MLIVDSEAPADRQAAVVDAARELVVAHGGVLVGDEDWGMRRLTYEIDHRPSGNYRLIEFDGEIDAPERIGRALRITDGLLRHRILRKSTRAARLEASGAEIPDDGDGDGDGESDGKGRGKGR